MGSVPDSNGLGCGNTALSKVGGAADGETLEARRARLKASSLRYRRASRASNTVRAYDADWKAFKVWCKANEVEPVKAGPEEIAMYLAALADDSGVKASTVRRRFAGLRRRMGQLVGEPNATHNAMVGQVLEGIVRSKIAVVRRVKAFRPDQMAQILRGFKGSLRDARNKALLSVGFYCALRRVEIGALVFSDVRFTRGGMVVRVARGKADQHGRGVELVVHNASDKRVCAVRALRSWLKLSQISEGPLFRSITRYDSLGTRGLSGQAISLVVKDAARAIGLDPRGYSGHSLRAGMATALITSGVSPSLVARRTRHKHLEMLAVYDRPDGVGGADYTELSGVAAASSCDLGESIKTRVLPPHPGDPRRR